MVDLRGDSYLNPAWPGHSRSNNQITHVAVHHDASVRPHEYDSVARYRSEAAEHYNRLGPGLQYHYKIDNTGTIFKVRDHSMWLYAVGSDKNVNTINICMDGYFHPPFNQKPTREQYEALSQLIIDLCENHQEFPATYPDVWAHRSSSQTACCGDLLVPYVFNISDKATAQAIPADAEYDWPEYQPQPPAPAPQPPVDNRPEWEKNFKSFPAKDMWSEGAYTVVDLANNNKVIKSEGDNVQLSISGETKVGGTEFWVTSYWVSKQTYSKVIPKAQLKDNPDPVVVPTPPPALPPTEQDHEERLTRLEKLFETLSALVNSIRAFLEKTFNTKIG